MPTVAQTLGVGEGLLYKWKQAQRPAAQEQELEQLRVKLKQVEAVITLGNSVRLMRMS